MCSCLGRLALQGLLQLVSLADDAGNKAVGGRYAQGAWHDGFERVWIAHISPELLVYRCNLLAQPLNLTLQL